MKDEIFKNWGDEKFSFNESVASVFDDMIARSVPFYEKNCKLICEFLAFLLPENSKVLDLGCSTANTLLALFTLRQDLCLCGIDNSQAMLELAKNKAKAHGASLELVLGDITECELGQNNAVILNYTLQFIKPEKRLNFLSKIYESLDTGGFLILSEKLALPHALNDAITAIYENYKKEQGYSRFEIAKKRAALENVLIPNSAKANEKLCLDAGFSTFECIFRWGNFATFVAIK